MGKQRYLRIDLDRKGLALFCLNNRPEGALEAYLDEALEDYENYDCLLDRPSCARKHINRFFLREGHLGCHVERPKGNFYTMVLSEEHAGRVYVARDMSSARELPRSHPV